MISMGLTLRLGCIAMVSKLETACPQNAISTPSGAYYSAVVLSFFQDDLCTGMKNSMKCSRWGMAFSKPRVWPVARV